MYRRAITVLRILAGAGMLFFGAVKLADPGFLYGGLLHQLYEYGRPYEFYQERMIARFVEMHQTLFAYAVGVGEMLVGLSLLAGALVNLGALGGIFLMLNFALATSSGNLPGLLLHLAFAAVFVFLGRAGAGLHWGVDGWLAERLPAAVVFFPFRLQLPGAPQVVKKKMRVYY